ncbi:SDR family NAD(P)-dependent oxidoreductase [Pendulispora albinea]|uniref:Type I polyketide synthase n=1 Tax=Pendulispora albinea TaxID=2741071 RepID=A0ABZ2LRN0_9BACT
MNQDGQDHDNQARLKEALVAIKKLRAKVEAVERAKAEPIAVIGIGCRFPGRSNGPDAFWHLLEQGIDAMVDVPESRWNHADYYDPDPDAAGKIYVRQAGFIDDVDKFDASYFGISPREAAALDPQQRLVLEVASEALEHAGQDPAALANTPASVFIGVMGNDYSYLQIKKDNPKRIDPYTGTGYAWSFLAGRLSHALGLQGQSIVLDTACSSSLVGVHLACRSLRSGESSLAIAGGVNLMLAPEPTMIMCRLRALAPDGRCKTFDAAADGYGRGEGCGMIVLKRLSDAEAAGDRVLAVIRGTASNHDGPSAGLTVPNGRAQKDVIRRALADARVPPADVSYVEAHGTGTELGDPIELRALWAVLGEGRDEARRLRVGSVKTNFGHLEGAAGISGLIKLILSLHHKTIPAHLHLKNRSEHVAFRDLPIEIPTSSAPWDVALGKTRIGGVSSFGLSGTNAHIVVEEAAARPALAGPVLASAEGEERAWLVPVSAKTADALRARARSWGEWLARGADADADAGAGADAAMGAGVALSDVAYTASRRRAVHEHRLAVVASTRGELVERLGAFAAGEAREGVAWAVASGRAPKVVFVYPGQGSQWVGMGQELRAREPVFREALEACAKAMGPYLDGSLLEELGAPEEKYHLTRIDRVQPMLFAMQVSLTALWRAWGVEPDAVMGHSMGEVAAAYVAGALSLEDAARVICERSKLVTRAAGRGGMALTELSLSEAKVAIAKYGERVSIAASNSPRSTVLSGEKEALEEILRELGERGVFARWVRVDFASHSAQMDPLRGELLERLRGIRPKAGTVAIHSTLLGRVIDGSEMDAKYWGDNLREPVLLARMVGRQLEEEEGTVFVEVSAHPILTTDVEACGAKAVQPTLRRHTPERASMLGTLGALWSAGSAIDWSRQHPKAGQVVDLPTYPWQRQRYWMEDGKRHGGTSARAFGTSAHPLLGDAFSSSSAPGTRFWEIDLDVERLPWLSDHRVEGAMVVPAAAYAEMVLAAADEGFGARTPTLLDVAFVRPLFVSERAPARVQLVLAREAGHLASFQIASKVAPASSSPSTSDETWTVHAKGLVRLDAGPGEEPAHAASWDPIRARCTDTVPTEAHYEAMRARGLDYGPSFQGLARIARRDGEALGRVELPPAADPSAFTLHPALLDACFQTLGAAAPSALVADGDAYLPVAIARMRSAARARGPLMVHATVDPTNPNSATFRGDLRLYDEEGHLVAEVLGLTAKRLDGSRSDVSRWFYELAFRPAPAADQAPAIHGTWAILEDSTGVGRTLAARLEARGAAVERIAPDAHLTFHHAHGAPDHVVYLGALDAPKPDGASLAWLHAAEALGPARVLDLVKRFAGTTTRLFIVTRGAQSAGDEPTALPARTPLTGPIAPTAIEQAAVWGFCRSARLEHPELRITCIDLDPRADASEQLERELLASDREPEIALRDGKRYAARLVRSDISPPLASPTRAGTSVHEDEPLTPAGHRAYRLEIDAPGVLDRMKLREMGRRPPGPGEVEIRTHAAGLNFLDVLGAMGMRPDLDPAGGVRLGGELAGTIVAVGEGETAFRIGDEVLAIGPNAFASHVTTRAELVAHKPKHLTFEQAAALPVAFLTAHYALNVVGRLRKGERVLIHSASGGTGLAAMALARCAGAEILATAGTHEKREYLRTLGAAHVFDSRSLAFAEGVRAATGGRGVDVVLNSLAGEAVPASLACLAPYGRFLEIGKRDIYDNSKLGLLPFQKNLTYAAIDLARMFLERPALCGDLLREIVAWMEADTLRPLPTNARPITRAADAFQDMAQARHTGKLVLTVGDPATAIAPFQGAVRSDGTYLVTGGLGGLGLVVAASLAARGAQRVLLVGRSAPSDAAAAAIAALEARGVRAIVGSVDVSDRGALASFLAASSDPARPLRGVVHAAAVLDDAVVRTLDAARLRRVAAPKADGAWNLHVLTLDQPLDFFVSFSSVAGVLGSPGQANYAAANAFLDALAHHRRALGYAAQSLDWGPFAEVGLAAASSNRGARLASKGFSSITPSRGMEAFEEAHGKGVQRIVMPLDLARLRREDPRVLDHPLLAVLAAEREGAADAMAGARPRTALREAVRAASGIDARRELIETHLREQIARTLRVAPSKLEVAHPLKGKGIDSLMAMELKNRIEAELGVALPVVKFLAGPSVAELAADLLERFAAEDALDLVLELEPNGAAEKAGEGASEDMEIVRL